MRMSLRRAFTLTFEVIGEGLVADGARQLLGGAALAVFDDEGGASCYQQAAHGPAARRGGYLQGRLTSAQNHRGNYT